MIEWVVVVVKLNKQIQIDKEKKRKQNTTKEMLISKQEISNWNVANQKPTQI